MQTISILITGVGSPLGQSIHKALKISKLPLRLLLMDSYSFSMASCLNEISCKSAPVRSPDFIDHFTSYVKSQGIQGVFWGTEVELNHYLLHKDIFQSKTPNTFYFADPSKLATDFQDKYLLVRFLEKNKIPAPMSAIKGDQKGLNDLVEMKGFPLIVKPRRGASSVGFRVASSSAELFATLTDSDLVQETLSPADAEYTVGIYCDRTGRVVADTVIKRELKFGLTYKGIVLKDAEISAYCRNVAQTAKIGMSINIQLIKTSQGPKLFELNPRLSSTTSVRAHFGVNEPELAIREHILGQSLEPRASRNGAVLRFWEEKYLAEDDCTQLEEKKTWEIK